MSVSLIDPTLEELAKKYLCKDGKKRSPGFKRKLQRLTEVDQRAVILRVEQLGLCKQGEITIAGTVETQSTPPVARSNAPIANANGSANGNGNGKQGKEGKSNVIRWTDGEWEKVMAVLRELRRTKPAPSLTTLLPEAQDLAQLPEHRRRKSIVPMSTVVERLLAYERKVSGLTPRHELQDEIDLLKMELGERPTKEQLMASLTEADLKPFLPRLLSNLTMAQFLAAFSAEEIVRHIPIGKLVPAVASVFTEGLAAFGGTMASISAALAANKAPVIVEAPQQNGGPRKAPQQQLMKITVLGPNKEQAQAIRERFQGRAKINVIDKQRGEGKITKDMIPASSDLVVFWARFGNHSDRQAIKAKQRSANFYFREVTDGGVDGLCRRIEEAMAQCELAAA